jgi:hypothetical protein
MGATFISSWTPDVKNLFSGAWKALNLGEKLEYTVALKVPDESRTSQAVEVETYITDKIDGRETFRFVNEDQSLPKAIIFRDSTSDFMVDLLAEHFSSSLFIWHQGLVYEDIIEREKPDIVLHIIAERFLPQYETVPSLSNFLERV